jgi:hypothetical protein
MLIAIRIKNLNFFDKFLSNFILYYVTITWYKTKSLPAVCQATQRIMMRFF